MMFNTVAFASIALAALVVATPTPQDNSVPANVHYKIPGANQVKRDDWCSGGWCGDLCLSGDGVCCTVNSGSSIWCAAGGRCSGAGGEVGDWTCYY